MDMPNNKKRKFLDEGRVFNPTWRERFFFYEYKGKPTCLICNTSVIEKEYNLKRHYEARHKDKFDALKGESRRQKSNELEEAVKKQQSLFGKTRVNDEHVKASFLIAQKLAALSKPYSDGELIKDAMLIAAELVAPEKKQAFANISLSRNTIADRIGDIAGDLQSQLKHIVK